MDPVDQQILRLLEENSRIANNEIAQVIGVSEGTVRNRISRLLEEGTIRRFTVQLRDRISALCFIKLSTRIRTAEFADVLKKMNPAISNICHITGDFSVSCNLDTRTIEESDDIIECIRDIPGVLKTQTITILKKY
ncbi:MAG: Lrp/AsnC family transcriptional regulator [archaeon]